MLLLIAYPCCGTAYRACAAPRRSIHDSLRPFWSDLLLDLETLRVIPKHKRGAKSIGCLYDTSAEAFYCTFAKMQPLRQPPLDCRLQNVMGAQAPNSHYYHGDGGGEGNTNSASGAVHSLQQGSIMLRQLHLMQVQRVPRTVSSSLNPSKPSRQLICKQITAAMCKFPCFSEIRSGQTGCTSQPVGQSQHHMHAKRTSDFQHLCRACGTYT